MREKEKLYVEIVLHTAYKQNLPLQKSQLHNRISTWTMKGK